MKTSDKSANLNLWQSKFRFGFGGRFFIELRIFVLCFSLLTWLSVPACSTSSPDANSNEPSLLDYEGEQALVLALATLGKGEDGKAKPLPARLLILEKEDRRWSSRYIEDPDSTAFHKGMAYRSPRGTEGVLTFGGDEAIVKFWRSDGETEVLWQADFGRKFSRMRDAEVGDIYGDGVASIAVVTHDQGVVAILHPDGEGGFQVQQIDQAPGVIIHEVELGDLNDDGVLEVYTTPSAPNRMDGSTQSGKIFRYVPALGGDREELIDLGERHAKEILIDDLDGDRRDELYISVEAISGGKIEIRSYQEDSLGKASIETVARLDDRLCRFLTTGDVDGDGYREMIAATNKSGIWLLRPKEHQEWEVSQIDQDSSGFEHASILLDLDKDGLDELYVASDRQSEVRRYGWTEKGWIKKTIYKHEEGLTGFTWNIMAVPEDFLP